MEKSKFSHFSISGYSIVSIQEQSLHLPCVKAMSSQRIIQRLVTQIKVDNDIILSLEKHLKDTKDCLMVV